LFSRQGALVLRLLEELHEVPSIKKASAQLNLDYENNKPETVKVRIWARARKEREAEQRARDTTYPYNERVHSN
ncbi:hypothetical protein ABTK03_21525, partial [Acinetobacter baumannii]